MALQSSGQISLNDIHIEAGGSSGTQCSLNDSDIRGLISKGNASQARFNEWYGASNSITITVLLVAGGGGGGSHDSGGPFGGGGAGGVLHGTMSVSPNSTHSFTIGAGGTAGNFSNGRGTANPGGNSTFNGATAIGGGGGGNSGTPNYNGVGGNGGSGGAGCWGNSSGRQGQQGNSGGLTGYGNDGGIGGQASAVAARAGGGGAGSAGYQNGYGAGKTFNMGGTNYYVGEGGGGGYHGNGSGYGGGGGGFGTGNSGVLIVTGPNNTVVKTSSGTLTISSGTLS